MGMLWRRFNFDARAGLVGVYKPPLQLIPARAMFATAGDSITNRDATSNADGANFMNNGLLTRTRQKLGGRIEFKSAYNGGISGNTTANLLARLSAIEARGQNNGGECYACVLKIGTNDVNAQFDLSTTYSNLDQILPRLHAAFPLLVVDSNHPRGAWSFSDTPSINAANAKLVSINAYLKAYVDRTPQTLYIDTYTSFVDPATLSPKAGYTEDGTHQTNLGADVSATVRAAALLPLCTGTGFPLSTGAEDAYNATSLPTGNKLLNGTFAGTGGTKGGTINAASVVPTSWVVNSSQAGNTGNITTSIEAAADGLGDWLVITVTNRTGAALENVSVSQNIDVSAGSYAAGERVQAAIEYKLINPVNIADFSARLTDTPGTGTNAWNGLDYALFNSSSVGPTYNTEGVASPEVHDLRTPTGTGTQRLSFTALLNMVTTASGGSSCVLKIRRPTLRRVP